MADQITNCKTYKEGATIKYHVVSYTLDSGEKFDVYVAASELNDPADNTEITSKANAKATDIKTDILAAKFTDADSSDINGSVTI